MKKLSIVRFHDRQATLLDIHEEKGVYTFLPPIVIEDRDQLSPYLSNRSHILTYFSPQDDIEESVILPSVIKNEATILKTLTVKLHDDRLITESLVLNKVNETSDPTGESTQHQFEGLYEQQIFEAIAPISQWEHLDAVTSEAHALFSISEAMFKNKSYLSVYTQENKNLIVAISNGTLLFSRIGELQSSDEIEKVTEQISDINRTVAYAHQQYREAEFEFIAISGNIADGEMATIQLQAMTGLRVTVMAPTLMVRGLQTHTAQHHILDIGMLYLPPNRNFLPKRVKAIKEFNIGTKVSLLMGIFILSIGLYFSFTAYNDYRTSIDHYHATRSQLEQTLQRTKTLHSYELQKILALMNSSSDIDHHFVDSMILFDDLLKLIKPNETTYHHTPEGGVLRLDFSKKYSTLRELYLFEKAFKRAMDAIKPHNITITPVYKTDYSTLTFAATITSGIVQNGPQGANP